MAVEDWDEDGPEDVELTTLGWDIGSATSHLMLSRVRLRRMGTSLSSRYAVSDRSELYRSSITLTPYRTDDTIDESSLLAFLEDELMRSGVGHKVIDAGVVVLTGEAMRRPNARAIAEVCSRSAAPFVCASAGHRLEGMMAAHGSGAVRLSADQQATVLNLDVGGGTSKLTLVKEGSVSATGAVNIGSRLIAMDEQRRVTRLEPAARVVAESAGVRVEVGEVLTHAEEAKLTDRLCDLLFECLAGSPAYSELATQLFLTETVPSLRGVELVVPSGGVMAYREGLDADACGDLGPGLASGVLRRLAALPVAVADVPDPIRATVVGLSQFSVQVSGETVFISRPETLPVRNARVVSSLLSEVDNAEAVAASVQASLDHPDLDQQDVVLAVSWTQRIDFHRLQNIAIGIERAWRHAGLSPKALKVVTAADLGASLGSLLKERLCEQIDILCIDGLTLKDFDYIDIGQPVHGRRSIPVVVKSLLFPGFS